MTSSLDHTLARMAQLQARISGGSASSAALTPSTPKVHANVRRAAPPLDTPNPTFGAFLAQQLQAQQVMGGLFDTYQTPSASFDDAGGRGSLGSAFGLGSGISSLLGALGNPFASFGLGAYGSSNLGSPSGMSGLAGMYGAPNPFGYSAAGYRYNPFRDLEVTSPFGPRPGLSGGADEFHNGVDYALVEGTPIPAFGEGTITEVAPDDLGGLGRSVSYRLDSGETVVYGHFSNDLPLPVTTGQRVAPGQIVGYSGSTGRSTGPHLHVGIQLNGEWVDPLQYLSLLP